MKNCNCTLVTCDKMTTATRFVHFYRQPNCSAMHHHWATHRRRFITSSCERNDTKNKTKIACKTKQKPRQSRCGKKLKIKLRKIVLSFVVFIRNDAINNSVWCYLKYFDAFRVNARTHTQIACRMSFINNKIVSLFIRAVYFRAF